MSIDAPFHRDRARYLAASTARRLAQAVLGVCCPVLLLTTGCATFPNTELSGYAASFDAAQAAATPIIADYAVAERSLRVSTLQSGTRFARGYFDTFEPADARAVATVGLPPTAGALDSALRAIALYNDTLVALAEGRNLAEARGQLRALVGELGPLAGAAPALAAGPVVDALVAALGPAVTEGNRREFQRLVLEGHPHVVNLIGLMRRATANQYQVITRPLQRRADKAAQADRPALHEAINRWHGVFGDYVVLLDAMEARLDDLREVVLAPKREAPLARASRGAAELRAYADALTRSLSELHATR